VRFSQNKPKGEKAMEKDITLQDESTLKPETLELKRGMIRAYLESKKEYREQLAKGRRKKDNDTVLY
jgi:hypothetical protein